MRKRRRLSRWSPAAVFGPYRTEVEAKTREKEWEQGEKNRKNAAGRVRKRKKEEIL